MTIRWAPRSRTHVRVRHLATSDGLPVPISLSHALLRRLEKGVDQGLIEGIGPDTKLATARYVNRQVESIDTGVGGAACG